MPIARAVGRSILEMIAPQGLSINAMIKVARASGGGYRYQLMRQDAAKFTGRYKYEDAIGKLKADTYVPRYMMTETPLKQPTKYQVQGFASYYDDQGNEIIRQRVSFYTNDYDPTGSYEAAFYEYQPRSDTADELTVGNFTMSGLFHNEGYEY